MKIRIKGNSIRIRLTKSEVAQFGETGHLEEKTDFGSNVFKYVLSNAKDAQTLGASFTEGKITVEVPDAMAREWITTDRVGYEYNMETGGGNTLFILIEKDFKCVDNVAEDQSDNYEHPNLSCA